jgi:hypothetical protein
VYAVVSAALGGDSLGRAERDERSAVLAAVIGCAVAAVAHGGSDPPPLRDALTCAWIAALAAVSYAALFSFAASFGPRGAGRSVALVLDWVLGSGNGALALLTPRAHLRNLLGGTPPLELAQRWSVPVLAGIALVMGLLCLARSRRSA